MSSSMFAGVTELTLSSVASLVVVGEPLEVLVLDPRHPVLVLVVVALRDPLHVALALLLLLRERVESLLLLVFAHGVPLVASGAGGVLDLIGHYGGFIGECEVVDISWGN